MNILLDSGYLIELFGKSRRFHQTAKDVLEAAFVARFRLHTLWECLAEASHKLSAEGRRNMLSWLAREGITVHASRKEDLLPMAEYMAKYDDASKGDGADVTDVGLVFLVDRLKTQHIFTVDHNDFSAYRTRAGREFKILWLIEAHRMMSRPT